LIGDILQFMRFLRPHARIGGEPQVRKLILRTCIEIRRRINPPYNQAGLSTFKNGIPDSPKYQKESVIVGELSLAKITVIPLEEETYIKYYLMYREKQPAKQIKAWVMTPFYDEVLISLPDGSTELIQPPFVTPPADPHNRPPHWAILKKWEKDWIPEKIQLGEYIIELRHAQQIILSTLCSRRTLDRLELSFTWGLNEISHGEYILTLKLSKAAFSRALSKS
jgi:hypothetical protein